MKKKAVRTAIAFLISLLLAGGIIICAEGNDTDRILCDATFSVGAIYLCIGLLIWVGNLGIFDMLAYGMISFINLFKKNIHDTRYANYLEYKEAKKESSLPWGFLAVIGLLYIAAAFIFLGRCS